MTMKELKTLHRGIWQSLVDRRPRSQGHEDDGFDLLWGGVLTKLSSGRVLRVEAWKEGGVAGEK